MSFADEVAAEQALPEQCKTCRYLRSMDPKLRAEVEEALASEAPPAAIARALTKRGFPVSDDAVRNHRKAAHVVR